MIKTRAAAQAIRNRELRRRSMARDIYLSTDKGKGLCVPPPLDEALKCKCCKLSIAFFRSPRELREHEDAMGLVNA